MLVHAGKYRTEENTDNTKPTTTNTIEN